MSITDSVEFLGIVFSQPGIYRACFRVPGFDYSEGDENIRQDKNGDRLFSKDFHMEFMHAIDELDAYSKWKAREVTSETVLNVMEQIKKGGLNV